MTSLVLNFSGTHLFLHPLKINPHRCTWTYLGQRSSTLFEAFWRSRRLFLTEIDHSSFPTKTQNSDTQPSLQESEYFIMLLWKCLLKTEIIVAIIKMGPPPPLQTRSLFGFFRQTKNVILGHIYSNWIHLGVWRFLCIGPTHCLGYNECLINICDYNNQYLNSSLIEIQLVSHQLDSLRVKHRTLAYCQSALFHILS